MSTTNRGRRPEGPMPRDDRYEAYLRDRRNALAVAEALGRERGWSGLIGRSVARYYRWVLRFHGSDRSEPGA